MTIPSSYPDTFDLPEGGFAMLSPAKINLGLKVLGKRRDGFHELDTLFQEISLTDRIEFHACYEWRLEIVGADLDNGESNLVTRAARLLAKTADRPCHARIVLHKSIPSGGGLGGGSSNAAIALIGLSRLWGLEWPIDLLQPLAAQIGSDCAFFIHGGLARGRGRGEVIDFISDTFELDLLLVTPPFGISTAEVYSWGEFPLTDDEKSVILESRAKRERGSLSEFAIFHNDLEKLVLDRYEDLREMKQRLLDLGAAHALLSGSGSSMFATFPDRDRMLRAAQQFRHPYRVTICHTVNRPRRRG